MDNSYYTRTNTIAPNWHKNHNLRNIKSCMVLNHKMRRLILWVCVIIIVTVATWGGYVAYRAHLNLVTLDVRAVDVRRVVRSIEWQTWKKIIVHRDVSGKVTLNVQAMPLEQVLRIISEQISSRWMAVYPVYSSRQSLVALESLVAGNVSPETNSWPAYQARPFFGGGIFATNARAQNNLVSITVDGEGVEIAALALARFAQAQVVPEAGTTGTVYLNLAGATMPQAVAQLATQVNRRWTRFYTLEPGFRSNPVRRDSADAEQLDGAATTNQARGEWAWREQSPEQKQQLEKQFEAQLATMTPEEKQRALERRARWQEMRDLTPEQRRERMAQLATDPAFQQRMQQRMLQRLQDSTPEQRAERDQRIAKRRVAQAATGGR
jgi:hypothetical protein